MRWKLVRIAILFVLIAILAGHARDLNEIIGFIAISLGSVLLYKEMMEM